MLRRISNSEVGTWLTCRRKYFYAFDMGIAPKKLFHSNTSERVTTLAVGTLGHEILGVYYNSLQLDQGVGQAKQNAIDVLTKMMMDPREYTQATVVRVSEILNRYWAHHAERDNSLYEVLDVEKEYDLPLTDEFSYVFRFDLLLKRRGTPYIELWDHKFKYDFFTDEAISLSGQMPKYLGALRGNGIFPKAVKLNQIRARTPSSNWVEKDYFKRADVQPSNNKITNAIREQVIASQEISEWRDQPFEVKRATALRSMDSFPTPCTRCPFNSICRMEYDGGDISYVVKKDFGPNTYDYNRDERL